MSMQPVASQASPPAWEEELHPRENYEVFSFILSTVTFWSHFSSLYHLFLIFKSIMQGQNKIKIKSCFLCQLQTLLNFAEQIGEAKPKGLSRSEIDQLQTYRVTSGSKDAKDNNRCVVCLVDFEEKQLVRVLPCLHEYHTRCIDKWLKVRRILAWIVWFLVN